MIRPVAIVLVGLVACAALSGCGKEGELDRPAPLWGEKAKAEYQAEQARKAAARRASTNPNPAVAPDAAQPGTGPETPAPSASPP
ncbi:MAG: hypothetical protein ACHP84_02805 [Caulobacterales bacterium]